jgi:hypothetical protein
MRRKMLSAPQAGALQPHSPSNLPSANLLSGQRCRRKSAQPDNLCARVGNLGRQMSSPEVDAAGCLSEGRVPRCPTGKKPLPVAHSSSFSLTKAATKPKRAKCHRVAATHSMGYQQTFSAWVCSRLVLHLERVPCLPASVPERHQQFAPAILAPPQPRPSFRSLVCRYTRWYRRCRCASSTWL